jgi:hypothetical protein
MTLLAGEDSSDDGVVFLLACNLADLGVKEVTIRASLILDIAPREDLL